MPDVISFPTSLFPDTQRLTPDANQSVQDSWPGAQTVITFQGSERWRLAMSLSGLTDDDRAEANAFVTRLRISRNVFLCVNHTAPQRGSLGGSPVVNSVSGGDLTADVPGQTSVASWVRNGDFVSVNCELKMVTSDAGTNGADAITFPVWPPFRRTPSSGDVVVVSSPCGAFRAVRAIAMSTDPPGYRGSLSVDAVEHVDSSYVADLL